MNIYNNLGLNGTQQKVAEAVQALPPHHLPSERGVLAAMLMGHDIDDIQEIVSGGDFWLEKHTFIFDAITKLVADSRPVDVVTVSEMVAPQWDAATAGQPDPALDYVVGLISDDNNPLHALDYAETIARKAADRRIIAASAKILATSFEDGDTEAKLAQAQKALDDARGKVRVKTSMSQKVGDYLSVIHERYNNGGLEVLGVPTGTKALDNILGGLRRGKMYVVAARPMVGKSSVLGNMSAHSAAKNYRTLFVSLEMYEDELINRQMAKMTGINGERIERGLNWTQDELERINDAAGYLTTLPLHIEKMSSAKVSDIAFLTRRVEPDIIFIDYLDIITADNPRASLFEQVTQISKSLTIMASQLDIPVVVACQLNRNLEARQNKRPVLSDLRNSGEIEQNAYGVIGLYRDELYNPETTEFPARMEMIVLKNRGGKTGTAHVGWHAETTSIHNIDISKVRL